MHQFFKKFILLTAFLTQIYGNSAIAVEKDPFIEAFSELPDVKALGKIHYTKLGCGVGSKHYGGSIKGLYRLAGEKGEFILKLIKESNEVSVMVEGEELLKIKQEGTLKLEEFDGQTYVIENNKVGQEEIDNLSIVKEYFTNHSIDSSAPRIILPLLMGSITDTLGLSQFYTLSPEAPGHSFNDLWEEYRLDKQTQADMEARFYTLGKSLSTLHLQGSTTPDVSCLEDFKTRYIHNDLHDNNIFENEGVIYFIDNEKLAISLNNPDSVKSELINILNYTVPFHWRAMKLSPPYELLTYDKIMNITRSFMRGYLENFKNLEYEAFFNDIFNVALDETEQKLEDSPLNNPLSKEIRDQLIRDLLNPPAEPLRVPLAAQGPSPLNS